MRTLLLWAGDNPDREGLIDTPARVVRAYEDWFRGYGEDPSTLLDRTFAEVNGYDEMVVLRSIAFSSHCEHHLAAITGHAHIGYLPNRRVIGISKLARVVDAHARRLQIQERMTADIANTLMKVLEPQGVGVVIQATHGCMTTRGVSKHEATMVTSRMLGVFRDDPATRNEFLTAVELEAKR